MTECCSKSLKTGFQPIWGHSYTHCASSHNQKKDNLKTKNNQN